MWKLDLVRVLVLNSPPSRKKWVFGVKVWTTRGKDTHCLMAIDIVWLKEEEIVTAPKYILKSYIREKYYGHSV